MTTNHADHSIPLPMLSDEAAAEIHQFLEVMFQLFEARYAHQIERYYDSISQHNIVQYAPHESNDDPPF
ncbi:MAG: hypothetical protein Q8Q81_07150 [Oxalobacteraceae bacterium]|nr:hypothetical protein [Oxalobacteraceae bacterium]